MLFSFAPEFRRRVLKFVRNMWKNRELDLVLHFECFLEALLDMSYVHITAVFTYIFAECIRTSAINKMIYVWCSPSSPIGPRGWPNVYIYMYIYIYIYAYIFGFDERGPTLCMFYHLYLLVSRIRCVGKLPHARPWVRIWLTWSRDSFPEKLWCHSAGEMLSFLIFTPSLGRMSTY